MVKNDLSSRRRYLYIGCIQTHAVDKGPAVKRGEAIFGGKRKTGKNACLKNPKIPLKSKSGVQSLMSRVSDLMKRIFELTTT